MAAILKKIMKGLQQFCCIRTRAIKENFMKHTTEKPAVQGGLNNYPNALVGRLNIDSESIKEATPWQVSHIARRHKLTARRAKLICSLLGIGGLL